MAWVVKSWETSSQPNENKEFVRITGRQEGVISWLLSLFSIDPTVSITVTKKNFRFESRTFWGHIKRTIPVSRISEIQSGFQRPWLAPIIFGLIGVLIFFTMFPALFNGEISAAFGRVFIAVIFFGIAYLIYRLNRYFVIGVFGFGGTLVGAVFKPSFIEGQKIDADAAERVGVIIQALVDIKT